MERQRDFCHVHLVQRFPHWGPFTAPLDFQTTGRLQAGPKTTSKVKLLAQGHIARKWRG